MKVQKLTGRLIRSNREVAHKKFKPTLKHKANLIANFVRLELGEGDGGMCLEDGSFYQNVLIL